MEICCQMPLQHFPVCSRSCRLVISTFFLFTLHVTVSASAEAPFTVEWKEKRLSVHAEQASLSQILQEVAHQTDVEVRGLETLQQAASVRFAGLPLRVGLQRLLAQVNYFLVEKTTPAGDAQPVLLVITGWRRTLSADAAGSQAEGELEGHGGGDDWQRLDPNLRLAQVQEANGADLQQEARILFAATQDPDPSIRQLAYDRLYEKGEKESVFSSASSLASSALI